LKIKFIAIGGVKDQRIRALIDGYVKRIRRYSEVSVIEARDSGGRVGRARAEKDTEALLKRLSTDDFNIALASDGRQISSEGLAAFLKDKMLYSSREKAVAFITGGPFGVGPRVNDACDMVMSLSGMTLPHELARLVIAEQVYRAFTIIKGEPYSH
jgi:23S rRNA (pseudouridine1915-N3)-methyltransferase